MENELQLLVVDFGNCCAVRVEKGRVEFIDVDGSKVSLIAGGPIISHQPCDKLREAIDQKPVPRIERNDPVGYRFISGNQPADGGHIWLSQEYDALTNLAGKPLPVWEGGKWTRLPKTSEYISDPLDDTGVKIWRYTR
jgi:hypothetical protein